jgi:hypothetical protein
MPHDDTPLDARPPAARATVGSGAPGAPRPRAGRGAAAARALVRRARGSWLVAAAAGLVGAPWVIREAVGDLRAVSATAPGGAVAAAFDQAEADRLEHRTASAVRPTANRRAATGRHLGFDTSVYPGERALRTWKESGAPYEWVGFYLPAPCHRDPSWSGKRETIEGLGFGTAVIYVGQQTWGRTPRPGSAAARAAARRGALCNADFVHGAQGAAEGVDAVARTAAEGFPRGTVIFLDIERMEAMPELMRAYYRAWTRRVLDDGRFVPGVYVHAHNARVVHGDLVAEYRAVGRAHEPPVWVASGRGFSPDKRPTDVGHQFAHVWQGVLDKVVEHGGVRLPIDVNVAAVPDPSAQFSVGE